MIINQIETKLLELGKQADMDCKDIYAQIDEVCLKNSDRVLSAFIENNVSYTDFAEMNGYGEFDEGRNK